MNYTVLDLETSIKKSYKRKSNPFDQDNYIVAFGIKHKNGERTVRHLDDFGDEVVPNHDWLGDTKVLVGQNIKFDLLYLWNHPTIRAFFKRGGRIYDIQYARYLISAQQHKWPSMNQMADVYGLELKPDKIKEYWDQGIETIDIPKDELLDYLDNHDLEVTEKLFKKVARSAMNMGMVQAIRERMEGLTATIEMEYNGIHVDTEVACRNKEEVEKRIEEIDKELEQHKPKIPGDDEFNWSSGKHLSAFLFGGAIPCVVRQQQYDEDGNALYFPKEVDKPVLDSHGNEIRFESGKREGQVKTKKVKVPDYSRPKTKRETTEHTLPGLTKPKGEWKLPTEGQFQTTEDVLEELANVRGLGICKLLIERKGYTKELGTYYEKDGKGMLTLVQEDGLIHHKLNNCQTNTGRLSSSDPNMQNASRGTDSNVVEMFSSRFGEEGVMGEVDYSSMEVVVQAWLSGDPNMIRDVNTGVDFHVKRLSYKLGESYETILHKCKVEHDEWYIAERRKAKEFSFQCLPTDTTQVLSKQGWVRREELKVGDEILSYNEETGMNEFTPVLDVYDYENAETIIIQNTWFRFESTPEHRWYGRQRRGGKSVSHYYEWGYKTTSEINTEFSILNTAPYVGGSSIVTPDQAALVGWIITDGSLRWSNKGGGTSCKGGDKKGVTVVIHQSDTKYSSDIKELLEKLEVDYSEYRYDYKQDMVGFYIKPAWFRKFWSTVGFEKTSKYDIDYSEWILQLSAEALHSFVDSVQKADGSEYPSSWRVYQNVGNISNAIQLAGYLAGYNVTVSAGTPYKNSLNQSINFGRTPYRGCQTTHKARRSSRRVFCVRTKNHTLVAKQGNQITITGNSAYGAGVKAISRSTGIPQDQVQALAEAENKLYPEVQKYNERIQKEVEGNARPTKEQTKDLYTKHFGYHVAPTGTRYGFTQEEAPSFLKRKGIMVSFSPTQIKNYSVQGEAGLALLSSVGRVWRKFVETNNYGGKAKLVNTVHDCVWIDMHKDVVDEVLTDVQTIMEDIPNHYKNIFSIDIPVKFTVESEVGSNLKTLKSWEK